MTLDDVCDVLPQRYCAQDHPCCTKAGFGFDETQCEAYYRQTCAQGVAAVAGHLATFNPSKIDECVAKIQPYEDKCSLDAADFTALATASLPCAMVFAGMTAPGGACATTAECTPATTANSFSVCSAGTCDAVPSTVVTQGAQCASTSDCAQGLVCGAASTCTPDPQPEYLVSAMSCDGADGG